MTRTLLPSVGLFGSVKYDIAATCCHIDAVRVILVVMVMVMVIIIHPHVNDHNKGVGQVHQPVQDYSESSNATLAARKQVGQPRQQSA